MHEKREAGDCDGFPYLFAARADLLWRSALDWKEHVLGNRASDHLWFSNEVVTNALIPQLIRTATEGYLARAQGHVRA